MPSLKGTETEQNFKDAFAGEIQGIRRYLYFAQKAEVEGLNDVAAIRRKPKQDWRETWLQRLTRALASAQSCTERQMLE